MKCCRRPRYGPDPVGMPGGRVESKGAVTVRNATHAVSVCCGCGGMDLGLEKAGWKIAVAVDAPADARRATDAGFAVFAPRAGACLRHTGARS